MSNDPVLHPSVHSPRGAINRMSGRPIQAFVEIPRKQPNNTQTERKYQAASETARQKVMASIKEHPEWIGTRWLTVWEANSALSAKRAMRELSLRVFRGDDTQWTFHLVVSARTVFLAVFPQVMPWSTDQNMFYEQSVHKRVQAALTRQLKKES